MDYICKIAKLTEFSKESSKNICFKIFFKQKQDLNVSYIYGIKNQKYSNQKLLLYTVKKWKKEIF